MQEKIVITVTRDSQTGKIENIKGVRQSDAKSNLVEAEIRDALRDMQHALERYPNELVK